MRRLGPAVISALVVGLAAQGATAARGPTLRLVDDEPLVVSGTAFLPRERVTVTALTLIGPRRAVVRATRLGIFRATLRLVGRPCGTPFAVRAVGALGSRATLRLRSTPCVPPPID